MCCSHGWSGATAVRRPTRNPWFDSESIALPRRGKGSSICNLSFRRPLRGFALLSQSIPRVTFLPKAVVASPVATTLRPVRGEKSLNNTIAACLRTFAMCMLPFFALAAPLSADEPATTTTEPAAASPDAAHAPAADSRDEEKQRKAMAGLLALCGILIGGLMFVVLVMIWGARLRRLARRELPAQKTLQNDLWFLKPPKSPPEAEGTRE